jgi:hypothetical protein
MSTAEAKSKLDAIMSDKTHAYWDRKAPAPIREKAVKEVQDLFEMTSGAA